MQTVYDWVTLSIFAGLVVLFLQRSTSEHQRDSLWNYLGAALGCAVGNYLGNEGHDIAAIATIAATLLFTLLVIKPFNFKAG